MNSIDNANRQQEKETNGNTKSCHQEEKIKMATHFNKKQKESPGKTKIVS